MASPKLGFQNGIIQALLTDFYQVTMAYAYWKNKKSNENAVFELYFRKNPFKGEFTIFAGLEECIKYLNGFKFTDEDCQFLRDAMPSSTDPEFFEYLKTLTAESVTLSAVSEGTVVFPREPLIRVEGPLAVCQLLETTLLNLVNFASLVTTNAARFRRAAGDGKTLFEFGLRRAQGPDGGLSASKYCYMGGFDGTSNVLAGKKFGIPVKGTHAHSFVSSFPAFEDEKPDLFLKHLGIQKELPFYGVCADWLERLSKVLGFHPKQANRGELRAFAAYAVAFPTSFLALVDTYDVLKSGIRNYCAVALALNEFGYRAAGVRLDSGDLAYLSLEVRAVMKTIAKEFNLDWFATQSIVASNDINEDTLISLEQQGHGIDAYGIGTHLVTCQKQPALGCVFKLVEINGDARMKISEDVAKVTIPGRKNLYRLFGHDGMALLDLMTTSAEDAPQANQRVLCRHAIEEAKRAYASPAKVESLLHVYWKDGKVQRPVPSLHDARENVNRSLSYLRTDHLRNLNPTPYKVSVTNTLYNFLHDLWMECVPISELT